MSGAHQPKIAILISTDKLSGAQNRAIKIYRSLRQRDYPAELWIQPSLRPELARFYPELMSDAVDYQWGGLMDRALRATQRSPRLWRFLNQSGLMAWRGNPTMERQLKARSIELVHLFLDMRIAYIRNTPTLFELTSPDIVDKLGRWAPARMVSHDAYHAVSPSVARKFTKLAPTLPLFRAAGPFFLPRQNGDRSMPKEKTIVFAHRFMARKNAVLFAKVAARFLQTRPDWKVKILGFGDQEEEIRKILAPVAGQAKVGLDPDLPHTLAQSSIFVSLIQPDNYPSQSVMEAMEAGNALLISDTGDSREMFLDGNGMLTSLDEQDVLDRLIQLSDNQEQLAAMGQRSRELAATRFNADHYLDELTSLYAQLAQ
ncbi:hypothetical protein HME9302_02619 [Alteripontixanthobacter maritimus]|uniref:Glycosyl transferase family 1 domain-containing protein n=1 Tax=Alteripontixanthobacter maritimus TaxID=2161824 RepID=A0A369QDS3_9SPHN|nr:glycosyltransferase [Alteripontixanthobacter maritimus]RDC61397.1 hypothetical protein HME9302_02619 [Alteripontixanthobacter maritimus]